MATDKDFRLMWKRRDSEIRGYERAIYTTMDNGDYLRVDYNIGDKRVRIYIEVMSEKGAPYHAVVSNGVVTAERNSAGRSKRVAENIKDRSPEFSTLPNKEVLQLINGNYGISRGKKSKSEKKSLTKSEIEETKRKYFKQTESQKVNPYSDAAWDSTGIVKKISLVDLVDLLIGIGLSAILFWINQYSFLALGVGAVFWGLLVGFFDLVIRGREPIFMKMFFFLIVGGASYLYGYF